MNCQYCGKEFKNQGSINLHERKCPKNPDRVKDEKRHNHQGCEHDWKLLNPNNQTERNALNYKYKEVCVLCQELR